MAAADFKGKVVVITGGNSGLGKETALSLSKLGARLVLTARDKGRLDEMKALCVENGGREVITVTGDITEGATRQKLVDATIQAFGRVDVLILNAGTMPLGFLKDLGEEAMDRALAVNVKAPFFTLQAFLPHLIKSKGNVVNISSILSVEHYPGGIAYSISKAALDSMTKASAVELGVTGVRVNSVNPGMVITESLKNVVAYDPMYAASKDPVGDFTSFHARQHALLRNAQPQEVIDAILFLSSAHGGFVTGVNLMVDGGRAVFYHRNLPVQMPDYSDLE